MDVTTIEETLSAMGHLYRTKGITSVRSQEFIQLLHGFIADELERRLTDKAKRDGLYVQQEVTVLGSHKPKDVDVAVLHPQNGPLIVCGVRSQMSSVGKNVLTYYQDIVGECISLQDRFPMTVYGYAYLHPKVTSRMVTRGGVKVEVPEIPDHARFARLYRAITGRSGPMYKEIRGTYDQFAYLVVDFAADPPTIDDALVASVVADDDLSIRTLANRLVRTFNDRHVWLDYFKEI